MAATSPVRAAQTRCPCGSFRRSSADGEKAPHDAQTAAASSRATRLSMSKLYHDSLDHELLFAAKFERGRKAFHGAVAAGHRLTIADGCRPRLAAHLRQTQRRFERLARRLQLSLFARR